MLWVVDMIRRVLYQHSPFDIYINAQFFTIDGFLQVKVKIGIFYFYMSSSLRQVWHYLTHRFIYVFISLFVRDRWRWSLLSSYGRQNCSYLTGNDSSSSLCVLLKKLKQTLFPHFFSTPNTETQDPKRLQELSVESNFFFLEQFIFQQKKQKTYDKSLNITNKQQQKRKHELE